jgi:hypothetical protein
MAASTSETDPWLRAMEGRFMEVSVALCRRVSIASQVEAGCSAPAVLL